MTRTLWGFRATRIVALVLLAVGLVAAAESTSIVNETLLGLTTDAGVYEPGSRVALEIVGPSTALSVESVAVLTADRDILVESFDPAVEAASWLGLVALQDETGAALPPGEYSIAVFTSGGAFLAGISIVASLDEATEPPVRASVSFSGPTLVVRQVATDADAASGIRLWSGNTLLVALAGNPTTGFAWSDVTDNALPVLSAVSGTEYFSSTMSAGLVGGGGLFAFRYEPTTPGVQVLRYEYARPWESVPPESVTLFSVQVVD